MLRILYPTLAILLVLAGACGGGSSGDDSPVSGSPSPADANSSPSAGEPTATPSPSPTATAEPPLTAEQVLARSDSVMAGPHTYRVQQVFRPASPQIPGIWWTFDVREALTVRTVYRASDGDELAVDCDRWNTLRKPLFSERTLGGLGPGGESRFGSTPPMNFALDIADLGDGTEVWVVSYDFRSPSVEEPIAVYRVEWIARDTFRLLRQEQWVEDPFGSTGHTVTVIDWSDGATSTCPASRPDLEPLAQFPAASGGR